MTESEKLDFILKKLEKLDILERDMQDMKSDMQDMKSEIQDMKSEMQDMKSDMQGMKSEIQDMKSDMQGMKSEIQDMKSDMQDMKSEIQDMKQDIGDIKHKVTKIDLTIENELRVNIQRVAEGHLDLSRNLHDAMKPSNEVEMLSIKVRMLESDVRDLKARLA